MDKFNPIVRVPASDEILQLIEADKEAFERYVEQLLYKAIVAECEMIANMKWGNPRKEET